MADRVHLDDMIFDAEAVTGLIYSKLTGWLGKPMTRAEIEDRPNAHGAFDVDEDYAGARVITFVGGLAGADPEDAELNFFDRIAALQADGRPFTLSVEKDWRTLSAEVSIVDTLEVNAIGDQMVAGVMVQMVARDPVKYGDTVTVSTGLAAGGGGLEYPLHSGGAGGALYYGSLGALGRIELVNEGTAEVSPTFVVTGELTNGFFLQCLETGQILRYDRVVPAGSTVTLTARTGEVVVDDVSDGSTYLTRDEFFGVPPASTRTVQFNAISGSSGSPSCSGSIRSGWW